MKRGKVGCCMRCLLPSLNLRAQVFRSSEEASTARTLGRGGEPRARLFSEFCEITHGTCLGVLKVSASPMLSASTAVTYQVFVSALPVSCA